MGEVPRSDEIIRWEDQGKTVIEGNPDSENIRYTLFKSVKDELGSHGEEVEKGIIPICWDNEEV